MSAPDSVPATVLPIIPLPSGHVLLPGVTKRIQITDRPDVVALLQKVFGQSAEEFLSNAHKLVGCLPLKAPSQVHFIRDKADQRHVEGASESPQDREAFGVEDMTERIIKAVVTSDPKIPGPKDLFTHGVSAKVIGLEERTAGGITVLVEGISVFKLGRVMQETPYIEAHVDYSEIEDRPVDAVGQKNFLEIKALTKELVILLRMSALTLRTGTGLPPLLARRADQFVSGKDPSEAAGLAYFMVSVVDASYADQLAMLTAPTVNEKLEKAVEVLTRNVNTVRQQLKNSSKVIIKRPDTSLMRVSPRFGRFQQSRDDDDPEDEHGQLVKRVQESHLSPEAATVAQRELKRLKRMMPAQAEYQVCRNYIENIVEVPWVKTTDDKLDSSMLSRARKQLNDDHHGLDKVKKRLLEYLAVLRLKKQLEDESSQAAAVQATDNKEITPAPRKFQDKSPILLLVGPPGVGKTSLAKSIATALGRKFHRISLGGVRDEAEIRGHRRTYVAALPGVIVGALKKVGVVNPVILLDEIDKLGGSSFHGDPSAAMLEVLDPEQNWSFTDHYMGIPLDLSKVMFIATANSLETIPAPLLDRMEMIYLSGYTTLEKKAIASRYLIPKQLQANGLQTEQLQLSDEVLLKVIQSYTREAGVRNLEREIGSVCRAKAVEFAEARDESNLEKYRPIVTLKDVENILGIEKYEEEIVERDLRPGVVTGLVAYSSGVGGSVLFIECSDYPGNGRLHLTGHLGKVLKESAEVALTWVKSNATLLGLTSDPTEDILKNRSVHLHCPSGGVPKDGPSAGCAITICLISLFSGQKVSPQIAMTGEMSLRGKVTAVGGIREKTIGAMRAGVKTVLLPEQNRKDGQELPDEVKKGVEIVYIRNIWEAIRAIWPEWTVVDEHLGRLESHL
ncbi:hypothetical protein AOL_s00004g624 [Orbilia oligospora ATCC 24927]|uniref:Lon protease homolog n=2 Tax=Orbilia oligospora TaxID=2813651 RepID=G1WZB3_ARTOA|nr:hypothetical protein AOL_s00004g624 [Orbilia oligospora ATCC 24927]EGX53965.1 hypothetical protein AOL_s00004g624 [Orbilia oligospora ATCC 24927]KAF3274154.1 hypothetical protein TWF970_008137 [Orbilia oligospora]